MLSPSFKLSYIDSIKSVCQIVYGTNWKTCIQLKVVSNVLENPVIAGNNTKLLVTHLLLPRVDLRTNGTPADTCNL